MAKKKKQATRRRSVASRIMARMRPRQRRSNPLDGDTILRTTAAVQGATILLATPIQTTVDYGDQTFQGKLKAAVVAVKAIPTGDYLRATVPSIAAETGIGARKLVKRALSKGFGLLK